MRGPVHPDWARAQKGWPNHDASQFIEAGRVRWHVQRMGSGPVLLLLHGAGAATHSWRDLMPQLAENYDVVAPDLPGHGFTRVSSRRQGSLPAMSSAISSLLEHMDLKPSVVVGHSAGVAIALHAVLEGTLSPSRVIGLNAALTPFRGMAGVMFPPLAKMLALNPFVPWLFSSLAGSQEKTRRLIAGTGSTLDSEGLALYASLLARPEHVDGALSMMALWELEPLLATIKDLSTPVDLLVGEGDATVPPAEAIELAQRVTAITTKVVSRLGHLMHEEDPARFACLIQDLAEGRAIATHG